MKTVIRPETEMKDSGIEWIGEIPSSWTIFPANGVFSEAKEKNTDLKFTNAFSFKYGEIVDKKQVGDVDNNLKETLSSYTIVRKNTIMINGLNLNYDFVSQRVAIVNESGVITSAYLAIQPDENKINPRFVLYLLKSYDYQQVFHGLGSGIRKTLKYQDFKKIMIVAPTLSEQQVIADYLDKTCSQIDEIIAEAKASIYEYKELKQSVIFEAVTKGLDKNVEFIDSGDEWLGKYPQSYNIGQLSMLSNIVRGGSPRPAGDPRYYGGNISFMRIADITKDDNIYVNSCENTITEEGLTRTRMIPPNTLLLTNSGATLGVPKINTFETAFNDGIAAFLDLDERLNIVYVYFFLKARTSYFLECASMGMGQPNLNTDIIGRTKIVFPTLVEQQKVVSYLEDRCGKLNSLISEKESLINDLEAYKKSLIYEVVTGKRKVV